MIARQECHLILRSEKNFIDEIAIFGDEAFFLTEFDRNASRCILKLWNGHTENVRTIENKSYDFSEFSERNDMYLNI